MSLEARVTALEEKQVEWDKVLLGLEGTTALILKEQMEFKKEVNQRFERLENSVNKRFDQVDGRFDKIEDTLVHIVHLIDR